MNNDLSKAIRKHTIKSNLLDLIGHAEMEKEIQKTVTNIIESQELVGIDKDTGFDLDEKEMRRYIEVVLEEVKRDNKSSIP
ncbi:MAG: hypothetical protein WBL67_17430 [Nitrososphaeraceae archaeon]